METSKLMTPSMWFHQNTKQNLTTPEVTRTVCDRRTLGDKRTWWEAASDTANANVLANLVSSCWCDTSASVLVLPSVTLVLVRPAGLPGMRKVALCTNLVDQPN